MQHIKNFTGSDEVGIGSMTAHGAVPPTVLLTQSAGSMGFYFNMLPDQARAMAKALTEAAAEAEAQVRQATEGGAP